MRVGIVEQTSAASLPSWTCESFPESLSQKQPRVKWEDEPAEGIEHPQVAGSQPPHSSHSKPVSSLVTAPILCPSTDSHSLCETVAFSSSDFHLSSSTHPETSLYLLPLAGPCGQTT